MQIMHTLLSLQENCPSLVLYKKLFPLLVTFREVTALKFRLSGFEGFDFLSFLLCKPACGESRHDDEHHASGGDERHFVTQYPYAQERRKKNDGILQGSG